jgi:hydroxymethylbilane synthase
MPDLTKLTVGTRGSKLALIQTDLVIKALTARYPKLHIEVKIITTKGDLNQAPIPLDTVGKAWFTEEIEQALLSRDIDLAIHSLKDLPPDTPAGLTTLSLLERADPRDVLVSKSGKTLAELPKGAIVGTDSIRRKALLLTVRPDLNVKSVRGNVDTRLKKLETEDYDAVVLAAAGLDRLAMGNRINEYLEPSTFIPAIGQGILVGEVRADDEALLNLLRPIQYSETEAAGAAEQAFSQIVGGGCKLPVGCYVRFADGKAVVSGMVGTMDARHVVHKTKHGPANQAVKLARELALVLTETLTKYE